MASQFFFLNKFKHKCTQESYKNLWTVVLDFLKTLELFLTTVLANEQEHLHGLNNTFQV